MKLPKRDDKHITESISFSIFQSKLPDNWILREITERDYGIDCYLEIVNKDNSVSGNLISIQLKGKKEIKWNKTDLNRTTLSGIKISTTNYWNKFTVPVFLCLVDIKNNEVFYIPVKTYIRLNYEEYLKQGSFSYKFDRNINLNDEDKLYEFLVSYFFDKHLDTFEENMVSFCSNMERYNNTIEKHQNLDSFLGLESDEVLFIKQMYININRLSLSLREKWELPDFGIYVEESQNKFGNEYYLYEQDAEKLLNDLDEYIKLLIPKLGSRICDLERKYWIRKNLILYNYVFNLCFLK